MQNLKNNNFVYILVIFMSSVNKGKYENHRNDSLCKFRTSYMDYAINVCGSNYYTYSLKKFSSRQWFL